MFKQTSPERAKIIELLAQALANIPMGATLPYGVFKSIASGFHNSVSDYWLLSVAREKVEKDLGCAFETVRGVGIKRLTSDEIPNIGLSSIRRIRRTANRGKKRINRVNQNSLTASEQRRVVGMSAMLGAIALIADGRKAAAVATVADPTTPIPPENILEMFRIK